MKKKIFKTKLVARGFAQEKDVNYIVVFSIVAKYVTHDKFNYIVTIWIFR